MKLHTVFQTLFGIVLLIWAAMGIRGWEPPPVLPAAEPLRNAIFGSGYIIPAVLLEYLVSGLAFVSNRFVPLAAVILAPVSLNILLYHAILNPTARSVAIASALFAANAYMLYYARAAYRLLLEAKTEKGFHD